MEEMRSFHIEFEDGSNPYFHFLCRMSEHKRALKIWRKNYELRLIKTIGSTEFYRAKEKNK